MVDQDPEREPLALTDPLSMRPAWVIEPTNKRPWPGAVVVAKLGGRQVYGRVQTYEWWWNGVTFPVKWERGGAVGTMMMLASDVEVIGGPGVGTP